MKFGPVPLEAAVGKILGHNVAAADGRRAFRKGKALTAADVTELRRLGHTSVYVAELEADDVDEDTAAARLARAVAGPHLRFSGPSTGRANLYATARGILRVDVARLTRFNGCQGLTLATLPVNSVVGENKVVATLKVLPYALPQATVAAATAVAEESGALLFLDLLPERQVCLILSASPLARERVVRSFETALRERLTALGSQIAAVDFVPLEDASGVAALTAALQRRREEVDLIILAGETAIMDRHDMAPRAVEAAGGTVTCFGAPVDPGNLLMLAYIGDVPVVGAPGCARSPKTNIVDIVLPRLLAGERLTQADVVAFGHGGLLEDVPERPMPRSQLRD
jgi:molybdenum cofactor cytidylyltransferase